MADGTHFDSQIGNRWALCVINTQHFACINLSQHDNLSMNSSLLITANHLTCPTDSSPHPPRAPTPVARVCSTAQQRCQHTKTGSADWLTDWLIDRSVHWSALLTVPQTLPPPPPPPPSHSGEVRLTCWLLLPPQGRGLRKVYVDFVFVFRSAGNWMEMYKCTTVDKMKQTFVT